MAGVLGTVSGQVRLDIRQAVASYAALRAQNAKTVYALRGAGDSFIKSGRTMAFAGAGIVYAFGKMVTAAGDFERRMDFFGAVTDTNKKKMKELTKFTLEMAKGTIFSVNEIADGMIELGKAGVSAEGIMRGIGKSMVNLAAAADIPLADAGQIITSTLQTFDMGAKKAVDVVNLLQGAANASIADVADLGVSLKYVGGVASATGVSFDSTLTAISLLAKAGIRGSTAGTSLRQMLVSLGGATGPATEELKKLGIITKDGSNLFFTQAGKAKDLATVFQILQNHTKDLTQKQRLAAFRTIFNNRALAAASILTRDGAKGFAQMNKAMKGTTAAEIAHKRLNNLSGDIQRLKNNLSTVAIGAGSQFQKQARQWVQTLTRLVKAFGKLDPKTQKQIIQTIAMSGAILLALGAFNIIIGTILKFVANMLTLGAGVKFVLRILKVLIFNLRWLIVLFGGELAAALGISVGALAAIVAIVAAVVIAFVILYKKWSPFRNLVNTIAKAVWTAIKAFGAFLKLLATDPGAAWDKIKAGVKNAVDAIGKWLASLPGKISGWLHSALSVVGNFVGGVGDWFAKLPGRVLSLLGRFIQSVLSLFTFRNLGTVLGFVLNMVIQAFLTLPLRILIILGKMQTAIFRAFGQLAPKVGYAIGFLIGRVVLLLYKLNVKTIQIIGKMIGAIVKWFAKLPGRVGRFWFKMNAAAIHIVGNMARAIPGLVSNMVGAIAHWVSTLPEKVTNFLVRLPGIAQREFGKFKDHAINFAQQAALGFVLQIRDLPSTVWTVLQNVISTIKSVIKAGFDAVKGFAEGLWNGFKAGLGIHSPSYIEKAMWQITGVMDAETKKIGKHTLKVQRLSRQLAATQFNVGGGLDPDVARQYRALASMHAANRQRARDLLGSAGKRAASRATRRSRRQERVEMVISNWHQGRGYMRKIADDAIEDQESFDDSVAEMSY